MAKRFVVMVELVAMAACHDVGASTGPTVFDVPPASTDRPASSWDQPPSSSDLPPGSLAGCGSCNGVYTCEPNQGPLEASLTRESGQCIATVFTGVGTITSQVACGTLDAGPSPGGDGTASLAFGTDGVLRLCTDNGAECAACMAEDAGNASVTGPTGCAALAICCYGPLSDFQSDGWSEIAERGPDSTRNQYLTTFNCH